MKRKYKSKQVKKEKVKTDMLKCFVPGCNRKYKREQKRQQHIEKNHYYETRCSNNYKFNHNERAQIYNLAASYIEELDKIRKNYENGTYRGKKSAKNLILQQTNNTISREELDRVMLIQSLFADRIFESNLYLCDWNAVMDDFQSLLNLGLPYYDNSFCPSLEIDLLWHALMQNPDLYSEICNKSYGELIPNCNSDMSTDLDNNRHQYFLDVFEEHFDRKPYVVPSTNALNIYSSTDIKQIFINLHNDEIRKHNEEQKMAEEQKKIVIENAQIDDA